MKHLLIILPFLFSIPFLTSQMAMEFDYNSEFLSCESDYNELDRIFIPVRGYESKYLLNGQPFTGCAKYAHKSRNGLPAEYMVAHIKDGYATKMTYYYPNGSISRQFNYKNGRSEGRHIMYHKNGDIYIEENYKDGRPHGTQKRWLENGDIGRIGFFNNGMPIYDTVYVSDKNC